MFACPPPLCFSDWLGGQLTSSGVSAIDFGTQNLHAVNMPATLANMTNSMLGNPGACWVSPKWCVHRRGARTGGQAPCPPPAAPTRAPSLFRLVPMLRSYDPLWLVSTWIPEQLSQLPNLVVVRVIA
jgi:hypothetical protein